MTITPEEIAELKAKRLAAWNAETCHLCPTWYAHTKDGAWFQAIVTGGSAEYVTEFPTLALAEYVALMHNALPALIATAERNAKLEGLLREVDNALSEDHWPKLKARINAELANEQG